MFIPIDLDMSVEVVLEKFALFAFGLIEIIHESLKHRDGVFTAIEKIETLHMVLIYRGLLSYWRRIPLRS